MAEDVKETRDERYARQINEQYAALGRYVQRFELVCFALRHIVTFTLHHQGLRNQQLAHIITGHRAITAQVLLDNACAVLTEVYAENKPAMEVYIGAHKGGTPPTHWMGGVYLVAGAGNHRQFQLPPLPI